MDNSTGVVYPQITIGKRILTLKFSLLAQFVLDNAGVDARTVPTILKGDGAGKVALLMKLFAAAVAHNYVEAGEPIPTAEQWAARIPEELWTDVVRATVEAISKVQPVPAAGQAVPATAQPN